MARAPARELYFSGLSHPLIFAPSLLTLSLDPPLPQALLSGSCISVFFGGHTMLRLCASPPLSFRLILLI